MLHQARNLRLLILSAVLLLPAGSGFAAVEGGKVADKLTGDEERFLLESALSGMMEVQLGKVAAQKGAHERVKEFGKRMQEDHTKMNERLKKIASAKNVQLPAKLSGKYQSAVERLGKLSGSEFDREYIDHMINAHGEDIQKFEIQAGRAQDPDVRKFAADSLPLLKKHLELAEATQKQIETRANGKAK